MADDLVTWLREQIAQTERVARAASPSPWTLRTYPREDTVVIEDANGDHALHNGDGYRSWEPGNAEHVMRHEPAAVLAQCEAHERVLERHRRPRMDDSGESWMEPNSCAGCGVTGATDLPRTDDINDCPELRDMALAYQHRPGYRSEWRP